MPSWKARSRGRVQACARRSGTATSAHGELTVNSATSANSPTRARRPFAGGVNASNAAISAKLTCIHIAAATRRA
jgi:hypothetical protein